MPRRLTGCEYQSVLAQVRESRHDYFDENRERFFRPIQLLADEKLQLQMSGAPVPQELLDREAEARAAWQAFLDEHSPDSYRTAAQKRVRYKRKSKKNATARTEILDHDAHREVRIQRVDIEWDPSLSDGNLVVTKTGDIGMVLGQYSNVEVRKSRETQALKGAYVKLLVNGVEEWHKKLSVKPLED